MSTSPHIKAALMLFDMVKTLEPKLAFAETWFTKKLVPTIDKWSEAEGDQGIKRAKDILGRGWLLILGENPGEPLSFTKAEGGVPELVKPLVERVLKLDKSPRLLSAVLSIVRVTDLWLAHGDYAAVSKQLKVINNSSLPGTAKAVIEEFEGFVAEFLAQNEENPTVKAMRPVLSLGESSLHADKYLGDFYSEKAGPNGSLTANAHKDYCSLREAVTSKGTSLLSEVVKLEDGICRYLPTSGVKGSDPWAEFTTDFISGGKGFAPYPGKISQIEEKSGKVRLVASPDYYTQKAMKPIHTWLMNVLRTIPQDCTFDQRSSIPKIARWQNEGRTVYSVDQSSCTDLFPMDCQTIILSKVFDANLAESVRTVMCDRSWEVILPGGRKTAVKWRVGQPMGIFGSWPLMALTHHLLVQFCYWRSSGRKSFKIFSDYVICGDDIVIASKSVAESYLAVVRQLGMRVNLTKSHISGGNTGVQPVSEFAKITIWKGKPLFPVRPNMVLTAVKDWRYAVPLFIDLANTSGFSARKKFLVRLIKKYFPSKQRILQPLLSVPTPFGGVGFRDSTSLRTKFQDLKTNEIHPWIHFLGLRIKSAMKLENSNAKFPTLEGLDGSILRQHPLAIVSREVLSEETLRGRFAYGSSELPSNYEISQDLCNDGIGRYAHYLSRITGDAIQQAPVPIWRSGEREKQLIQRNLWEKSLKRAHYWPCQPVSPIAEQAIFLRDVPTVHRNPSPDSQLSLVTRILTAQRFAEK